MIKKEHTIIPIEEKRVYSTLGCGDAFISGFVHGLCEKKSLHQCMLLGLDASDIILSVPSATDEKLIELLHSKHA